MIFDCIVEEDTKQLELITSNKIPGIKQLLILSQS